MYGSLERIHSSVQKQMNMNRHLQLTEWHSIQQSNADCQKCCQHWPAEVIHPLKFGDPAGAAAKRAMKGTTLQSKM
jgi:hypothetical protein